MGPENPENLAAHSEAFSHEWVDVLERYCAIRMEELGVPEGWIGDTVAGRWRVFIPEERTGGYNSRGITINSGCLNPGLLGDGDLGRIWGQSRLRDRIDAILAHEYEELRGGSHEFAVANAPITSLPISESARRILRSM